MVLLVNLIAKLHWVLAPFVSLLSSQTRIRVGNGRPFGPRDDADGCQLAFSLSLLFISILYGTSFLVFIYDFLFFLLAFMI